MLDGVAPGGFNARMSRLPRSLLDRRMELARNQAALLKQISELEEALKAIDYSLRAIDPEWVPPKLTRPVSKTRLPRGAVSSGCLALLRRNPVLWTSELASMLAEQHALTFVDRRAELDFASAVAMALRRYEGRGFVEIVEKEQRTKELRWRLGARFTRRLELVAE